MMTKTTDPKHETLHLRIEAGLAERLEVERDRMRERHPGMVISLATVVRTLLLEALEEREHPKARK